MKMLIKIAAAMAIFLVVNALLKEHYMRNAVARTAIRVLDEAIDEYPHPISTLFVGDSHMGRSVDPREFGPGAYSLWSPGQYLVLSYYRLDAFLKDNDPPIDRLVVAVSHHSFVSASVLSTPKPPWPKYVRYAEVGEAFDLPTDFALRRARATFMPYAGQFEKYFLMRKEEITVEDVLALQGTLPHPDVASAKEWTTDMARARLRAYFRTEPEPLSKGQAIYLGRIVELGRERDAEVVLITTPVTRAYWESAATYLPYDEFYAAIAAQEGATYLDYHDLLFDRPELYRDVDHLNEAGSAIFTERLKADLAALGNAQE